MRKIIAGIVAAVYSLMLSMAPVMALSTVTASVTVETFCMLDATPTSITFDGNGLGGSVTLGGNSGEDGNDETVTLTNIGNKGFTSLTVIGVDWVGPGTLDVSATSFEDDGTVAFDETLSDVTPASLFSAPLADGASDTVDFRVGIPSDLPAGTYSQDITFTFECNSV